MYGEVIKFAENKKKPKQSPRLLSWIIVLLFAPVVIWVLSGGLLKYVASKFYDYEAKLSTWIGNLALSKLDEVFMVVRRANKLNNQHFADELASKPDSWLELPELGINAQIQEKLHELLSSLSALSGIKLHTHPTSRTELETVIKKLFHCIRLHSSSKPYKLLKLLLKFTWMKRQLTKELASSERVLAAYHTAQTLKLSLLQDAYSRSEISKTGQVLQSTLLAYMRFAESSQANQIETFNAMSEAIDKLHNQVVFCSHLIAEQAGHDYCAKDGVVISKNDVKAEEVVKEKVLESEAMQVEVIEEAPKPTYVFVIEGHGTEQVEAEARGTESRHAKLSSKAIEELKARQMAIPQQPIVHLRYDQEKPPMPSQSRQAVRPLSNVPVLQVRSLMEEIQLKRKEGAESLVFGD
mmetsp:Transcript_24045/g.42728  ORF Transcript_24045/g.42728 Transcript_24045/m.42728 type:complete len:409 (+) Transcript_24045:1001-2227(+)